MAKSVVVFLFFVFLFNLSFSDNYENGEKKEVIIKTEHKETENINDSFDKSEKLSKDLENELNKREKIETKIVKEKNGIFEIGTYSLSDSVSKTTRNNYKKYKLKKDDKIIITHIGTNYDGTMIFEIIRKGFEKEKVILEITSETMPIYSFKEFK